MYWYRIMYKAKINMDLAKQQGLSKDEIDNIIVLQQKRSDIRNGIINKVIMPTRQVGEELSEIDVQLTKLWKFDNPNGYNFYKFWKEPGCLCPEMDNEDNYGKTSYIYIIGRCPLHGKSK